MSAVFGSLSEARWELRWASPANMPEAVVSACERLLVRQGLLGDGRSSLRVDLRREAEARKLEVEFGPQDGMAEVVAVSRSDFETRVAASVRVTATEPYPDRPDEGIISLAARVTALAREQHDEATAAVPSDDELTRSVERIVRDCRALESEALCILGGRLVWAVKIDVDVLDYGGNCLDVSLVAVMAALMHARRPDVSISGEQVTVHGTDQREPVPLPVIHLPVSSSFAVFHDARSKATVAVLDPNWQEERAKDAEITIAANAFKEICGLYKAGGAPVDPDLIMQCSRLSISRAAELNEFLRTQLALSRNTEQTSLPGTSAVVVDRSGPGLPAPPGVQGIPPSRGENGSNLKRRKTGDTVPVAGMPPANADEPMDEPMDEHGGTAPVGSGSVQLAENRQDGAEPNQGRAAAGVDMSLSSSGSDSDIDLASAVIEKPRRKGKKKSRAARS